MEPTTDTTPFPARILVVEDEPSMREALHKCLAGEGYRVITAENGEKGLQAALHEKPELMLLDIMMPRLDGFAVCAELRRLGNPVPVLMLTAKGRVEDRVHGLDAGADDYLMKPFSTDELLARVRALLRRVRHQGKSARELVLGAVRVDFVRHQAWRHQTPLELTAKEFHLVRFDGEGRRREISPVLFALAAQAWIRRLGDAFGGGACCR